MGVPLAFHAGSCMPPARPESLAWSRSLPNLLHAHACVLCTEPLGPPGPAPIVVPIALQRGRARASPCSQADVSRVWGTWMRLGAGRWGWGVEEEK